MSTRGEFVDVFRIEVGEQRAQLEFEIALDEQPTVSVGRDGEAVERADAQRLQRVEKLAEGGDLAAHAGDVFQTDFVEVERINWCGCHNESLFNSVCAGLTIFLLRRRRQQSPLNDLVVVCQLLNPY